MTYAELLERTGLPTTHGREGWPAASHAAAMITKLEGSGVVVRTWASGAANMRDTEHLTWIIQRPAEFERRCERKRAVLCQKYLTGWTYDWEGDGRMVGPSRKP